MDTLSKPAPTTTKAGGVESGNTPTAVPNAANRLIVRNLPFNATDQDLRAVFLPYGPVYSIHIPLDKEDKDDGAEEEEGGGGGGDSSPKKKKARTKGFAFVWMLSKKDAEKAIEGCNGTTMRAGTAESLVLDKQKRKKQKRLERKMKAGAGAKGEGEEGGEGQEAEEVEDDGAAMERVIAVDWALSKERWEEEKAKMEREREDVEMRDVSESEDEDEDEEDEENLGVHEEGDHDEDEEDVDRDEDVEEPVKPALPPPEAGTTLFIRNVPFNATEDELRTLYAFSFSTHLSC